MQTTTQPQGLVTFHNKNNGTVKVWYRGNERGTITSEIELPFQEALDLCNQLEASFNARIIVA